MKRLVAVLVCLVLVLGGAVVAGAEESNLKLRIEGEDCKLPAKVIDGEVYVPAKEVCDKLNLKSDTYTHSESGSKVFSMYRNIREPAKVFSDAYIEVVVYFLETYYDSNHGGSSGTTTKIAVFKKSRNNQEEITVLPESIYFTSYDGTYNSNIKILPLKEGKRQSKIPPSPYHIGVAWMGIIDIPQTIIQPHHANMVLTYEVTIKRPQIKTTIKRTLICPDIPVR